MKSGGTVVHPNSPVEILVVEDDENQRASIVASIEAAVEGACVAAVAGRDEALDILLRGEEAPKLVLLDLGLAQGSGLEVLDRIRSSDADNGIAHTPVVIFTDSQSAAVVQEGYRLGANSYVIKPLGYLEFQNTVGSLARYWMSCNQTTY